MMNVNLRASVALMSMCALAACGAPEAVTAMPAMPTAGAELAPPPPVTEVEAEAPTPAANPSIDLSTLPPAPWSEAPLELAAVPRSVVDSWRQAPNREWCAPMALSALGEGEGAEARTFPFAGGWAVAYDRRGLPGMLEDGEPCERCGRAVFGVVGTAMSPEELADPESDLDAPAPSYNDGSHAAIEADEEDESAIAAASVTVSGQDCVYQVWSFLGAEHVEELLHGLRRVAVRDDAGDALARR
jgi:hypothetical protein